MERQVEMDKLIPWIGLEFVSLEDIPKVLQGIMFFLYHDLLVFSQSVTPSETISSLKRELTVRDMKIASLKSMKSTMCLLLLLL
jgi:hypothetical protein